MRGSSHLARRRSAGACMAARYQTGRNSPRSTDGHSSRLMLSDGQDTTNCERTGRNRRCLRANRRLHTPLPHCNPSLSPPQPLSPTSSCLPSSPTCSLRANCSIHYCVALFPHFIWLKLQFFEYHRPYKRRKCS